MLEEDARVTGELSPDEIARLFDPLAYQGAAQAFIDRLLATTANPPTNEEKRSCP